MRILFLNITSFFCNRDMLEAFDNYRSESGKAIEIICYNYNYQESRVREDPDFEKVFLGTLREYSPDFVFSFNFLPVVSKVCNIDGVPYISWIYDNPEIFLYSYQTINPCNIIFTFDSKQYEFFRREGVSTVEYLPMAASTKRLDSLVPGKEQKERFEADISFVGSLYTERKQYYQEIFPKLTPYTKGYLEALITSQMCVHGINFIEESLPKEVTEDIQKVSGLYPSPGGAETMEYLAANYIINREITIRERKQLLTLIGERHPLKLYTYMLNNSFSPKGVENRGAADYYNEMPYIFKLSRINLNITLRSIQSAIPLRAYDILGSGGFLMSNYQVDLHRHFVPGEDYIYYEDKYDLLDKIDYYLKHEDERKAIAENGHNKVKENHTFDVRVKQILEVFESRR